MKNMDPEQKKELIKQNSERIKSMDDNSIKSMVDMMKGNREYMRNMYRAQGVEMSDEQLDMISNMMSPEMIKNASDMLASNPDLINQVKPPANFTAPPPSTSQASSS